MAGTERREGERAKELQRRRDNTAEEAAREMLVWKAMKLEHNGIDPKVCLAPRADVLCRSKHGGQQ